MSGKLTGNPKIKLGNWFETQLKNEEKMKEFLEKKKKGELLSQKVEKKFKFHTKHVDLSLVDEDGNVTFGSKVMVFNEETKGFLSVDLDTKESLDDENFGVSTTHTKTSGYRNTLVISKVEKKNHDSNWMDGIIFKSKEKQNSQLHYNQPFIFKALKVFYPKSDLYLHSKRGEKSPITDQQLVSLYEKYSYECVWKVLYRDPKYRYEFEGQPIKANHPVVIQHCATGLYLSSETKFVLNDFGKECEVSCQKAKLKETQTWHFVLGKQQE